MGNLESKQPARHAELVVLLAVDYRGERVITGGDVLTSMNLKNEAGGDRIDVMNLPGKTASADRAGQSARRASAR